MAHARPGSPESNSFSRNDLTTPDLYGDVQARYRQGTLTSPRPSGAPKHPEALSRPRGADTVTRHRTVTRRSTARRSQTAPKRRTVPRRRTPPTHSGALRPPSHPSPPRNGRGSSTPEDGASNGAVTGARRSRWCPSRSATPGWRWGGSPSSSRSARGWPTRSRGSSATSSAPGYEGAVARAEEILYLVIVTLLTVSALAYLLTRLGFFYRTRSHHRASRAGLERFYDARQPTLTTIIPSYQEDARVIRNTLLSAALQEYPGKRVVLLIDDPHAPRTRGRGNCSRRPGAARARSSSCCPGPPAGSPARCSVRGRLQPRRQPGPEVDDDAGPALRAAVGLAGEPGDQPGDHRPHRRVLRQRGRAAAGGVARTRSGRRCATRRPRASCCTRRCSAACTGGWRGRSAPR